MPLQVGYRRAVAYDSGLLGRAEVVSAGKGAVRKVGPGVDNPPGSKNELLNYPALGIGVAERAGFGPSAHFAGLIKNLCSRAFRPVYHQGGSVFVGAEIMLVMDIPVNLSIHVQVQRMRPSLA